MGWKDHFSSGKGSGHGYQRQQEGKGKWSSWKGGQRQSTGGYGRGSSSSIWDHPNIQRAEEICARERAQEEEEEKSRLIATVVQKELEKTFRIPSKKSGEDYDNEKPSILQRVFGKFAHNHKKVLQRRASDATSGRSRSPSRSERKKEKDRKAEDDFIQSLFGSDKDKKKKKKKKRDQSTTSSSSSTSHDKPKKKKKDKKDKKDKEKDDRVSATAAKASTVTEYDDTTKIPQDKRVLISDKLGYSGKVEPEALKVEDWVAVLGQVLSPGQSELKQQCEKFGIASYGSKTQMIIRLIPCVLKD